MRTLAERLRLDDTSADRETQLARFRDYLKRSNAWIIRYHRLGGAGLRVVHCRSIAMDILIERLHHLACQRVRSELGKPCTDASILALGGYGRSELCPYSDIDIMFLYPEKVRSPHFPDMQRLFNDTILYMLWDLNLKVGHSTRTIREAIAEAEQDEQSKNAMLESRLICGDSGLYRKFAKEYDRFIRKDDVLAYLRERLQDQLQRRERNGNSVFIQEPDIKNGVGGLRDYQNMLWMVRLQYDGRGLQALVDLGLIRPAEREDLHKAYDFLLRVRNELHLQLGRGTDLLDFEKQPPVALALGYHEEAIFPRVERFMRDYYRAAAKIFHLAEYLEQRLSINAKTTISFQSVIASRRLGKTERFDGFALQGSVLYAEHPNIFKDDPVRLIRVFRHLQSRHLQPDFDLQRLIEENLDRITTPVIESEEANRAFRSILQSAGEVYPTLHLMNQTGVLSRFIPEWAGLHCLVQHEFYHRYTADEHVLKTIRELDQVFTHGSGEQLRKYRKALEKTSIPTLLYLILFLHDIGKSHGIESHAETGVTIALPILDRLHVVPDAKEKILQLIAIHLEMARIWQRYDLDDPKTTNILCDLVGDLEQLRYLYVLTFCDARGTSKDLWNGFKDSLHTQLYKLAESHFETPGARSRPAAMISQSEILGQVNGISEEEVEAHFNLLPDRYFSYHSEQEILLHLRMIHQLLETISRADSVGSLVPVVEWEDDLNLGLTVVHIITWDRAGLFYKLAGAFTLAGLSIMSSKALSRADHITIDTFYVADPEGGPVKDKKALGVFKHYLGLALIDNRNLQEEIRAERKRRQRPSLLKVNTALPAPIPVRVDVYHELSLRRTIIEIEANDEIGLLYEIARTISEHGFDITFARIATERKVAVDTFYIEPSRPAGDAENSQDLIELKEALCKILEARRDALN